MGHAPGAEKEDELEVPLGRSVTVVHDQRPATSLDRGSRLVKSREEVIHEMARGQADFLRHPQLIARGAWGGK
jgi:hypothetical protein